MWMQTVNKDDAERAFVNVTNGEAATITTHWAIHKFGTSANVASVSTNEGGINSVSTGGTACEADGGEGGFIGLSYEDIAPGAVGVSQVYGYHESFLVMRIVGSVTVIPGSPIGPGAGAASIGMSSTGALSGMMGPVIALDTITSTLHSLGTTTTNWANHCFIRAL